MNNQKSRKLIVLLWFIVSVVLIKIGIDVNKNFVGAIAVGQLISLIGLTLTFRNVLGWLVTDLGLSVLVYPISKILGFNITIQNSIKEIVIAFLVLLAIQLFFDDYLRNNKIEIIFSYLTAANTYACLAGKQIGAKVYTGLRNAKLPIGKHLADCLLTNNLAEKAIANCYSGKKNFVNRGFCNEKVCVIPNCFEQIKPYVEKTRKDKVHIITVGRFVKQKDYETAIRAVAELKKECSNVVFDIVGYGELEEQIRMWIKSYNIDDIVTIHLNPPHIPQLLDEADIYLSTSLFEGTSNSIMEGMNADLPIIATNVGDNGYLVEHGANGLLGGIKDYKTISEYLIRLTKNTEERVAMGKLSKLKLLQGYSMDIFRERYVSLIENRNIK